MRYVCSAIVFIVVAISSAFGQSQQQATVLLQQSLAAQTGGTATTDVTLSGTATLIHSAARNSSNNVEQQSAQTESGPMTLAALANGTTQVVLQLPSGTRTETWSKSADHAIIIGVGPKGTISQLEGGSVLMPSAAWFSPAMLTPFLSTAGYTISFIASETRNGTPVQHLAAWQAQSRSSDPAFSVGGQHNHFDLYLNRTTLLPVSAVFSIRSYHAPGTKPLSIRARPASEEVSFSDYRLVQGRMLPFHIQVFLGSPRNQIMDFIVSSAIANSGASISIPAAAESTSD